ncbi:hypothetical protein DET60_102245 [Raoultella planticola]|uniref:hypothetical protein n=1 Tax=Raoultella planticola TaxID=575 RepID=UPI001064337B|nr:hypothetical protein [Raoultella planticola]TDV08856.1 hypothetical protein DFO76_103438 [Raoultella planticola]TDX39872.1 hypothetical protein DET60_102245 [Raoultella planticola]
MISKIKIIIVTTVLFYSTTALPFDIQASLGLETSVDVGFTVGLDDRTRQFLEQYPPELRQQIEALLVTSLGLVDKSVYGYIDKINNVMDDKIRQLKCVRQSVVDAPADSVSSFVDMLKKSKDGPSSRVREMLETLFDDFSPTTPAYRYNDRYADLSTKIGVALCKYDSFSNAQAINLTDMLVQVTNAYRLWFNIYKTCTNAVNCLDEQNRLLNSEIKNADKRDVDKADAVNVSNEIIKLYPKINTNTFLGLRKTHFIPRDFEREIAKAYNTIEAIKLAEIARIRKNIIALNTIQLNSVGLVTTTNEWISLNPAISSFKFLPLNITINEPNPDYKSKGQIFFSDVNTNMTKLKNDLIQTEAPTSDAKELKEQLSKAIEEYQAKLSEMQNLISQGKQVQTIPIQIIIPIPMQGISGSSSGVVTLPGGVLVPPTGKPSPMGTNAKPG